MKTHKHPEFTPVTSSVFNGVHHDPNTSTLTMRFNNGDVWQYDDVPLERAHSMQGAASPGKYFADKIKGQYTGRKLG